MAGDSAVAVQGGSLDPTQASRQGRYWSSEVPVGNVLNPWRGTLTIFTAKRGTSGSPDVYRVDSCMAEIAAHLQLFTYDLDGNLLSDGLVDYHWDAENRLIGMETTATARTAGFPHRLIEFRYDYMGRRVQKRVVDLGQTPNVEISCRRFLYDGWNLIAEFNAPGAVICGALLRSYTWGLDIVNTMSSAGGVGALLQIADHPSGKTYLPTYDGNGNIAALLNAASGSLAAAYEYGPFGEPLRAQTLDATVADNPFRFSTKWTDLETGLVYYGHRYYDPKNGRFINRDPIEESGGLNLYGFCGNNGVNRWDVLGCAWSVTENSDGSFKGYAWEEYEGVRIELGDWNFSSRADAEHWASMRSRWEFDERGGIKVIVTASSAGESMVEDPNTVEGRPRRQLGAGTGPYYGNSTWTGTAVYSSIGYNGNGVGSPSSAPSMGRPVLTKESQNNSKKSATSFVPGDLSLLGISIWLEGTDAPNNAVAPGNPNGQPTAATGDSVLGSIVSGALDLVGKVWNLPNTVLGFVAGGVGYVAGAIMGTNPSVSIGNNAIQFTNLPFGASGGGALTLGNVQLYHNAVPTESVPRYDQTATVNLGRHEEAHTYQSQLLGPLFLPGYFATGGISKKNPLETAADNYAAGGRWWPWP